MRHHVPTRPAARAVAVALLVVALQAAVLAMFVWPSTAAAPHELPIVLAGPPPATAQLASQLNRSHPGAFAITTTRTPAAADRALRHRDAYGALLLGPHGMALHVASAASPAVAALLEHAVAKSPVPGPVPVTDVAPGSAADPHGSGLTLGLIPLVITSLAAGAMLAFAVRSRMARVAGLVLYALLAGAVATTVLQPGFGVLAGDFGNNASAVGLLALAVAAATAGLAALFRAAGVGLAALVIFFAGIPLSGLTSAPELLPQPWGALGQLLPPGAGGWLLRSTAYFGSAGAAGAAWVLAAWAAAGLLLVAAVPLRRSAGQRAAAVPSDEPAIAR